jgi:acyl dehydratase
MDAMANERYLEDLHVGDQFHSADYTLTEAEIIEFGPRFNPQPFHTDPEAAKRSIFGGLIASGWYTAAIVMRLRTQSDLRVADGLIGMGMDDVRWPRPVRAGDTLHLETEVIEVRPARSRPAHGIVRVRETVLNQAGQTVLTMVTSLWVPRRK